MKKGILRWVSIPFLLFVLILAGCANDEPSEKEEETNEEPTTTENSGDPLDPLEETAKVVIAEDGSASGAGFYIADALGYFEEYNIEVEFATFANSDEMLPAVAAGEVDVAGGISSASFFNSIAQGIDVKFIADKGHNVPGDSYFTFVIREDLQDEIKDYADLEGMRIAVSTQNAVDDYIFEQMLNHAGLTRDDVEFVLMSDFGNMLSAMANKQIDAALQIEPLITQGESEGIHVKFLDATDFAPEAQIAMVLGSPVFLEDRPEVAKRFMAAYIRAVRDYNDAFVKDGDNKDEIIEVMTEYTALKDPGIWQDVGVTGLNPNGQMFVEDIEKQYEMYKANGAIQGEIDFDEVVDMSVTDEVVEILGEYE